MEINCPSLVSAVQKNNHVSENLSAKDNECIPFLPHLPTSDLIDGDVDHRRSCEGAYCGNVVRL